MGWFSDIYHVVVGSAPTKGDVEKARRANAFQLQNQACSVIRKCLDVNGIDYDEQVRSTVLSLVTYNSLIDPVNRNQLISRCAYFFSETPAMKKRGDAIGRKRSDIASVNRLRSDLARLLNSNHDTPDAP